MLWTSSFSTPTGWASSPSYWQTISFPDVNGDGLDDVCGRGGAGVYCALSLSTHFETLYKYTSEFGNAAGWTQESRFSTLQFPDIDGDGSADICGRDAAGIRCAVSRPLSSPNAFVSAGLWTTQFKDADGWSAPQHYRTIQFADVNGDGMDDVCGRGTAGVHCGISYGTPAAEFDKAEVLDVPVFSSANGFDAPRFGETMRVVDVNGDGRADVCARGYAGIHCALARSYWAGFITGWTDLFDPQTLWVANFGDDKGWGADEAYWGTIEPANITAQGGAEFCGRGYAGIICSNR